MQGCPRQLLLLLPAAWAELHAAGVRYEGGGGVRAPACLPACPSRAQLLVVAARTSSSCMDVQPTSSPPSSWYQVAETIQGYYKRLDPPDAVLLRKVLRPGGGATTGGGA